MHSAGRGTVVHSTLSVILLSFMLAAGGAHAAAGCSSKDADAADAALDHLDSWAKLAAASKKYGHCDDGAIAEGFSEAVARLLVDQWPTLPALAKLTASDPALKKFVLRHIDTTLDTGDAGTIAKLARTRCSRASTALCQELSVAALRAAE